MLGRMHWVAPKDKERYFLRTLLLKEKGMTSYEDLKGEYETFEECCIAKGYAHTDEGNKKNLQLLNAAA